MLEWLTGKKRKDEEKRSVMRKAQDERIQGEQISAMHDFWQEVILTNSERVATIDEFDADSIKTISDLVENNWTWGLQTKNPRQIYSHQLLWGSYYAENPEIYIIFCYPNTDSQGRNVSLGRYSDGVDVLKSRYDLINKIFTSARESRAQRESEEQVSRKGKLNSILRLSNDAS